MSPFAGASATTATATFRDLRRRPGIVLAALAVAALLLVLPDICARAGDESAELSLQVGVSTIILFLTLVAGFAGLRAGAAEGDLGAAPEWRAAPIGPGAYVMGRFGGVLVAAAAILVALTPFVLAAQFGSFGDDPPELRVAALTAAGALLAAAQFAALGLVLATLTSQQLAAILLVGALVASRTLVPAIASRGDVLATLAAALPDPARLDLSRELAFHRPVDTASAAFACVGAALQTAACLCAAAWALGRRET